MTTRLTVRTTGIADPGPLADHVTGPGDLLFTHDGDGLVAHGPHLRIPLAGSDRFAAGEQQLSELFAACDVHDEVGLPGTGPVAFGAFTFDPTVSGSVLLVPHTVIGRRGGRSWRTVISGSSAASAEAEDAAVGAAGAAGTVGAPPPAVGDGATRDREAGATAGRSAAASDSRVRYQGSTMSEMAWLAAVDRAVARLRAGQAQKVVLARDRRVWSRRPFDIGRLVTHLARRFPSCQTFSVDGLVGASPETLIRREGRDVESVVLAGTAPRGADRTTDEAYAAALRASDKDAREHALAVESVRRTLDPVAKELDVDAQPSVMRLANVMHLATTVRARMDDAASALALAGRLHPSAAVCGTPTAAALQLIRTLEGMDRARYSGPVGWVDARGDGRWAIALRCAELDGTRGRLFAGAGIVDGSLPEAELEETRLKLRAMQSAFDA